MNNIWILVLTIGLLSVGGASCNNQVNTKEDCDNRLLYPLVALVIFQESVQSNSSYSAAEKQRRIAEAQAVVPILLSAYSSCLNDVPSNPYNPFEVL